MFRLRNAPKERASEAHRAALAKQAVLRSRMTAVLQAQKLDAVAYPVLRRKAVRIGETQTGFTCQLSANSGLPAISIPAGFTVDGVPVGMELLAQSFQEAELLALAHAWERLAAPRRPPFSTPQLVAGEPPKPMAFEVSTPGGASDAKAKAVFSYDATTGKLRYSVSVEALAADDLIAVTLQRGQDRQPGPVIAQLLRMGQAATQSELDLRAGEREALARGQLYLHLYTRRQPLGGAPVRLELPTAAAIASP